jgi:hypothetical protein
MINRSGFYWDRDEKKSGIIPNYFLGWDTEFGIIWKGETLINNFGLYLNREQIENGYFKTPNYYIGWVRGVGIIWKGQQYLPEFMRAIGGPSYCNTNTKISKKD